MVTGYIRVSTEQQDVQNQRHEILEFANTHKLRVDKFIQIEISSRKDLKARGIEDLISRLKKGDVLIVSELSRLGRSIIEVISIINELIKREIRFVAIKQNLDIKGNHDMQSKVMVTIFSLLAELERDLISLRTKKALAAKRAQGVVLGRRPGSIGKSKLDNKLPEIVDLLKDKASYSFMARRFKVSRPTIMNFIKTRKLESTDGWRRAVPRSPGDATGGWSGPLACLGEKSLSRVPQDVCFDGHKGLSSLPTREFHLTSYRGSGRIETGWGNEHGSKYRVETMCPGASGQKNNPVFRSAYSRCDVVPTLSVLAGAMPRTHRAQYCAPLSSETGNNSLLICSYSFCATLAITGRADHRTAVAFVNYLSVATFPRSGSSPWPLS